MTDPDRDACDILLVEDNPLDVKLTLHAFERNHLANRVHVARDGAEALDYLLARGAYRDRDLRRQPRIVLLDLKLPKVDGLSVLREMRADPRTRAIPVAILTSSDQEVDVVRGYELGCNSYIVKPVDFERFMEAARLLGMYWLLVNHRPASAST